MSVSLRLGEMKKLFAFLRNRLDPRTQGLLSRQHITVWSIGALKPALWKCMASNYREKFVLEAARENAVFPSPLSPFVIRVPVHSMFHPCQLTSREAARATHTYLPYPFFLNHVVPSRWRMAGRRRRRRCQRGRARILPSSHQPLGLRTSKRDAVAALQARVRQLRHPPPLSAKRRRGRGRQQQQQQQQQGRYKQRQVLPLPPWLRRPVPESASRCLQARRRVACGSRLRRLGSPRGFSR